MIRHALVFVVLLAMPATSVADSYRDTQTLVRIQMIESALDFYREDAGRFPSTEEGLRALIERPDDAQGWQGPYLASEPRDAWDEPFVYLNPARLGSRAFDLYSKGVNLQDERGSGDDITSWSGIPREFYTRPFPWALTGILLAGLLVIAGLLTAVVLGVRALRRKAAA